MATGWTKASRTPTTISAACGRLGPEGCGGGARHTRLRWTRSGMPKLAREPRSLISPLPALTRSIALYARSIIFLFCSM